VHIGPTGILGLAVAASARVPGVPVRGVLRDGPADRAGISGGELITAIDTTPTPDATALTDVLDGHRPGDTVTVTYLDSAGAPRSVPVTLIAGPPN
jgi:serine protease Do